MEVGDWETQVLQHLQQCGLDTKKLAVFLPNDADSIAVQVCRDLGTVCEQKYVDFIAALIKGARSGEPLQKRLRGDFSCDPFHGQLLQERRDSLHPRHVAPLSSNVCLESDVGRPSRRSSRPLEPEDERQKRETNQKESWSRELYKELKQVDAPALLHLEHCVDQKHLHLALAGRTRPNTPKRYLKTWRAFKQWLVAVRGDRASPEVGDLVEYLFSRFDEPCGPTIPPLIVKAVVWFERIADLDRRERIGESQAVCSVRDYLVEMLSRDKPPTQRAPRYPVVMMEAFEHIVEDETLRVGFRLVAWIKLVKLWASLRWDDVQRIVPKELKYYGGRMTTVLRSSKTTGPTKRAQELPVCVSEHAYIANTLWLKTGFDLLKKFAPFERDYLLPKLNLEWSGFRRVMATYNDISSYSARLRRKLKRPGELEPVAHPILAPFWTEHSERATVPTGLALLGTQKDERDMLGRWKPDGSDTYVRMYNGIIARLQYRFAKAARQSDRTKLLDERDIVESAMSWITERCEQLPEELNEQILKHLEVSMEAPLLANWTEIAEDGQEDVQANLLSALDMELEKAKAQTGTQKLDQREPLYVVVNTGRRCKRLHKSRGGCWMGRGMNFKSAVEFFSMPETDQFTHYCKVCWPKTSTRDVDQSSTSSSTSISNSADSSEGESSE